MLALIGKQHGQALATQISDWIILGRIRHPTDHQRLEISSRFGLHNPKAIAADAGAQTVLKAAGVKADAGVVGADDTQAFVNAASTRQWAREKSVRTLA
eukprot:gene24462-45223_t